MTKEDKLLWATWMASTDISEYAVDIVLDFDQMDSYELNRIWDDGLHVFPFSKKPEFECVAYPYKTDKLKVMLLTPHDGKLLKVFWDDDPNELDELIVAELKRVGFVAPWVSGLSVKNILVAKWGKNRNKDD